MSIPRIVLALVALLASIHAATALGQNTFVSHALAMHGQPKYASDFSHFEYVNPRAHKGGTVRFSAIGTYDSLNPFILKGVSAAGLSGLFDTLTYHSDDEAFSEYGLLAESIELPEDRSWVTYTLRAKARFHDGSPVTVEDVIFSLNTLKTRGHPFYRAYYANVEKAQRMGERSVRFSFSPGSNRELALIIGQMPVLSKAYWASRDFEKTTLEPPLGSGPYKVEAIDPGRSITYRRDPNYWGATLPVNVGRDNFGIIRFDYYRDGTVALEAFKAGEYDIRQESVAKNWATAYDSPALQKGWYKKENIAHQQPTGMQGFVFNTRREIFQDRRVREALAYAFDFEWTNKNLFYGAYTRTRSYFSNSELASRGLPDKAEFKILEPYRGRIPEQVFSKVYQPPVTDGSGNLRTNLRQALRLLKQAGWQVKGGKLVNHKTGQPFRFELLLVSPSFERVALPFKRNLKRIGIEMNVRTVDTAQYERRVENFDFDMIVMTQGQSLSPGNEQRNFWTSAKAGIPGSRNLAGIKDPVVDDMVELLIAAPDRQSLIERTRALDRVLLWGHYVIPHWHLQQFRVAYWDKFDRPQIAPKYDLGLDTWWVDPAKEAALDKRRGKSAASEAQK